MCSCQSKVRGMKTKGLVSSLTNSALPIGLGFLAAEMLGSKITISANPLIQNGVLIAAGAFLASSSKGMIGTAGLGIAAKGVVGIVGQYVTPGANGIGLYPGNRHQFNIAGSYGDGGGSVRVG